MLALLCIIVMAIPVIAKTSQPTWGTFTNSGEVPEGSTLILNIVQKVENSYDSGLAGYWALITYTRHIQIWQTPEDTFYIVERDNGKWYTFEGASSPYAGTPQTKDGSGTFHGGSIRTMTGTFNPEDLKTKGSIGTVDYLGTKEFIKLGTYAAQGTPDLPGKFDWIDAYFDDYTPNYESWGWTYTYRGQTWNNYDYGNSGDIII